MSDSSGVRELALTNELLEFAKAAALTEAKKFGLRRENCDNAVQEALLELVRRPPKFDPTKGADEKTFIYTIVQRAVLKFRDREQKATTRFEPTDAREIQQQTGEDEAGDRQEAWTLDEILKFIDNDDSRALCKLVIQCKGNISEAARTLGLSEGTVRYRLKLLAPKLLAAGFNPFSIGGST